ncbi:MAG TPA: IclR family transcriptional regulator [Sphingomonas sp.]|jgi:DNA-binding IclR family transcriptional regulator|uniref:IclR family transcriptional regulator n=1 Tax=Sphingomonas sp. TaxID=28214 RepID=UPI002ED9FB20
MTEESIGVGVIVRATAVLRALGDAPEGLSLGKIAQRVGLARSTVQRLISALEAERLVVRGTQPGRIVLGPEVLRLARLAFPTIIHRIRPLMQALSDELAETVDFATISRNQMVFLDQVAGRQRLMAVSHVGDAFPLHCSSVGKSYLATATAAQIESLIGTRYEQLTSNTITDLPGLLANLEPTRETGIGIDAEEHSLGICAVGFCFSDEAYNWFGLSVPVPTQRFVQNRDEIVHRLIAARTTLRDMFHDGRSGGAGRGLAAG